jgi:hypothetical protein
VATHWTCSPLGGKQLAGTPNPASLCNRAWVREGVAAASFANLVLPSWRPQDSLMCPRQLWTLLTSAPLGKGREERDPAERIWGPTGLCPPQAFWVTLASTSFLPASVSSSRARALPW